MFEHKTGSVKNIATREIVTQILLMRNERALCSLH